MFEKNWGMMLWIMSGTFKLGENNPTLKAVMKHITRGRSLEVKGWVKMQQL